MKSFCLFDVLVHRVCFYQLLHGRGSVTPY